MSLEIQLEDLERFSAKVWRTFQHEDPISKLSFNEYDYLKALQSATEPMRLTDLAAGLEVSKPSATNMVKRLEKKDLVTRIACIEDARSKRVTLTDYAKQSLALESKVYTIMAQMLTKNLTPEESTRLEQLLNKAIKFN